MQHPVFPSSIMVPTVPDYQTGPPPTDLATDRQEEVTYGVPLIGLGSVALIFLRLGLVGFGGPAAHIALMHEEFVGRRRWISPLEFLDLNAVTNLIPGPASTEMALHLGHRLRGLRGMVVAGACFITPAALMVLGMAMAYQTAVANPTLLGALQGLKTVTVALILLALVRLVPVALPHRGFIALAIACGLLRFLGLGELWIFVVAALIVIIFRRVRAGGKDVLVGLLVPWFSLSDLQAAFATTTLARSAVPAALLSTTAAAVPSLAAILGVFFKIGATIYGSGYVLLPYLETELVRHHGWLTQQQILDAVAVAQLTPGPLFTGSTFCGYLLGGIPGAVVATVAIFLPGFILVAMTSRHIGGLRSSPLLGDILDGVNAAAIGLMGATLFVLGREAIPGWTAVILCGVYAGALFFSRVHPLVLLVVGAGLGAALPGVVGRGW